MYDGTVARWARDSDQLCLYWFPSFDHVVVANFTIVPLTAPGNANSNAIVHSTFASFNVYTTVLMELAQSLGPFSYPLLRTMEAYMMNTVVGWDPDFLPIYTEDGVQVRKRATGVYHRMWEPLGLRTPFCVAAAVNNIETVGNALSNDSLKLFVS